MSKWFVAARGADFQDIAARFHIDPVTARLIRNRGVIGDEAIRNWLTGDMRALHDPKQMTDMERAADILAEAVRKEIRIRIIGDYDVDGICAAYILYRGLALAGAQTDYVLPDRIRDGYGMNASLIRQAAEDGVRLILTCDNGIRALDEVKLSNDLGIRVVVTDHHTPKVSEEGIEELPEADAVVDPWRQGDAYPFKTICGAVVAYKFLEVFFAHYPEQKAEQDALMQELVVFAAFATTCDVMPLLDENRSILKEGLRRIGENRNRGLAALIRACGLQADEVVAGDFGFKLGPCLNATGRLDSAHRAMTLLLSKSEPEAVQIAGDLIALNEERKTLTAEGVIAACNIHDEANYADDKVLVIYLPDCHESLAGIIAGRVRERYAKPAIILTDSSEAGFVKGSGRSVPQYDMYRELSRVEALFERFGGHEQAAGLTMKKELVDELRRKLNDGCKLTVSDLERELHIDMEMPLSYVTLALVKQFSKLEPFGKGNPEPLFVVRDVRLVSGRVIGKNHNVGKYVIADSQGKKYDMITFDGLERFNEFLTERFGAAGLNDIYDNYRAKGTYTFHMAYNAQINNWQGREDLQFRLVDFI